MGEGYTGEPRANHERLTVAQAAASLGITEGAVRSRIKRGTLPTTKEGGTVFVLLGGGTSQVNQTPYVGVPSDQSELVASLQDQVGYLREQLNAEREARTEERRRHDTVVAQLTSKIPAIEAPQEPTEAAGTVEDEPERESPGPMPQALRRAYRGPGGGGCSGVEQGRKRMKVPFAACLVIGALVLGCALASVVIRAAEPCWRLLCIPPNTFLAMGLVSVGVITFFGFLAYGTEPEDMRTAIAVALVAVYLILVGESAFFGYLRKSVTLDPLTQAMITSFTTIVGIVIPTYFGASAYTQTRDARRTEVERERDALRREVEELRAIQRGEGPGGREGAT